jgi:hypothetical protein
VESQLINLEVAWSLSFRLVAWALLLSGLEMLWILGQPGFQKIWSFKNLQIEFEKSLPLNSQLANFLLQTGTLRLVVLSEILISGGALLFPQPSMAWILLATHLLICFRFRGTFNGGSDMMIFVVLTGLALGSLGAPGKTEKLGLLYICIHTLYSYFKAGWVKLREKDWQRGKALPQFLARSLRPLGQKVSVWLSQLPVFSVVLSWSVIFFEVASLALILNPRLAPIYGGLALIFHFMNYLFFGLNRFFWAWLAAWPAVIFTLSFSF